MPGLYEDYMAYVAPFKGSERYHKWSIIAAIAALMERRVHYSRGGLGMLYPNLYVLLVGGPGSGKSTVARVVTDLVKKHNRGLPTLDERIRFAPTKFSPAALIEAFQKSKCIKGNAEQSALWLYTSELSVSIKDIGGGAVTDDLLEYFDCPAMLTKETLSRGHVELIGVCLNVLGCTTPSFISRFLPREQSGTGLAARLIMVPEFSKIKKDYKVPQGDPALKRKVLNHIARIHGIEGQMQLTDEADAFLEEWFYENDALIYDEPEDTFMRDFLARKDTMVTKVAMCLSASRSNDLLVQKEDIVQAVSMIDEIQPDMLRCFTVTDSKRISDFSKQILNVVPRDQSMSQQSLLMKLYEKGIGGSLREFENNIEFLVKAGLLKRWLDDDTIFYRRG